MQPNILQTGDQSFDIIFVYFRVSEEFVQILLIGIIITNPDFKFLYFSCIYTFVQKLFVVILKPPQTQNRMLHLFKYFKIGLGSLISFHLIIKLRFKSQWCLTSFFRTHISYNLYGDLHT